MELSKKASAAFVKIIETRGRPDDIWVWSGTDHGPKDMDELIAAGLVTNAYDEIYSKQGPVFKLTEKGKRAFLLLR